MSFRRYLAFATASLVAVLAGVERRISNAADAPVRLEAGFVSGAPDADRDVRVFKGIPFAAPPVGPLRWHPPQPVAAWEGVRAADRFSPSCQQPPRTGASALLLTSQWLGHLDEDCLYLNVWTTARAANARLPVMVWFPGGGFTTGGGSALIFDGDALAKKGVVLVTTNYRLGVFGFFAHPELTKESDGRASGNYGLMDQIAALQWVQQNIAAFGGDPHRVTIFGQSAGATSVLYLMASPSATGLFHSAIGQSGGGTGGVFALDAVMTQIEAEQAGVAIGQALGAASLSELRALPALDLQRAAQGTAPIVDGHLVPDLPDIVFRGGRQHDVPLLVGSNADDAPSGSGRRNFFETYFKSYPDASERQANVDAMAWRVWTWADLHARTGKSTTYLYYFMRAAPTDAPAPGAYHGAELPYVFGNLHLFTQQWGASDRELERVMSSYWVNFAASGDPNGPELPPWPAYQRAQRDRVMRLGDKVEASHSGLDETKISLFDTYHAKQISR